MQDAAVTRSPGRRKTLHLTWVAFFLTFVVWFNIAPFQSTIGKSLGLSEAQRKGLYAPQYSQEQAQAQAEREQQMRSRRPGVAFQ